MTSREAPSPLKTATLIHSRHAFRRLRALVKTQRERLVKIQRAATGVVPQRFSSLLARCREQEPDIEIRLFEVPLSQQVRGLRDGVYDVGFSRLDDVGEGVSATPVWTDQLVAVVPTRHPLLVHKRIPIRELVSYPLIIAHPHSSEGWYRHIERILRTVDAQPAIAEYAGSTDLLLALIAAGYGVGFAADEQLAHVQNADVVTRPLEAAFGIVTTYLLTAEPHPSPHVARFVERISTGTIQQDAAPTARSVSMQDDGRCRPT